MGVEGYSLVLSTIAIIGTAITYFKHDRKIKRQQIELNEYQLKKNTEEELNIKKAELGVNFYRQGGEGKLKIFNKGQVQARNIRVEFDKEYKYFVNDNPFPVEFIHPQRSLEITISLNKDTPNSFGITITWDDDFATNRTVVDNIQTN